MHLRHNLAVVAAAIATAVSVSACGQEHNATARSASPVPATPTDPETTACRAHIPPRLLPTWARTGFSDPRPHMPYVLGAKGSIAAIVWADPLVSPPAKEVSNKILWVSHAPIRPGVNNLDISAQRIDGEKPIGKPVSRQVVGGPGPSIIDLPAAGCWHLTLRWSGHTDTMDLRYSPLGRGQAAAPKY
jgi:hypothetical protein